MKLTIRTTLLALPLLMLPGAALADVYIRGTQASYDKQIDKTTKENTSSVYIDEANDLKNVDYAEFVCEEGAPLFFLNSGQALITQKEFDNERTPELIVRVDGGAPLRLASLGARNGDKPNLKSLALDDKYDAQMLRLFQTAKSKIVVSLIRYDKKPLNFNFYTKGFNEAFKAINNCQ